MEGAFYSPTQTYFMYFYTASDTGVDCNKCQHLCRYVEIRLTQKKTECASLTEIICGKIWTTSNQTLGSKHPLDRLSDGA